MTDMYQFKDNENTVGGGMSVSTLLKNNKNMLDVDGVLFSRFSNLVVPLGLQLYPHFANHDRYDDNSENESDETSKFMNSKKFDQLFYSVGKDLGMSNSKTHKNRTMKNPTK